MELALTISSNEVLEFQREYRDYICDFPGVRKSEHDWITGEIVRRLSAATSQKGGWAVSDTIKPTVVQTLTPFNLSDKPAKVLRAAEMACRAQQRESCGRVMNGK